MYEIYSAIFLWIKKLLRLCLILLLSLQTWKSCEFISASIAGWSSEEGVFLRAWIIYEFSVKLIPYICLAFYNLL